VTFSSDQLEGRNGPLRECSWCACECC